MNALPDTLPYEGIVVLGAPRSGSTLLRRLLDAHPKIACPAETYLFGACARFLKSESFGNGLATGVVPGLSYSGIKEQIIHQRLRELVFGFLRELADQQDKPLWAEKTAFDTFLLPGFESMCGDHVRYVAIVRHGLDAVHSIEELIAKMARIPAELHPYFIRDSRPLDACLDAWMDCNKQILDLKERHPDRVTLVRYEDLTNDPAAALSGVFDFLGIETDITALLEEAFKPKTGAGLGDWKTYQLNHVSRSSVGRYRAMPPTVIRRLAKKTNTLLESLGYEKVVLQEEDDAMAKRRLELELLVAGMKARQ
ncbi:MAG: sulfotransferase [Magnetococcales bacterium]|nr:sulfotransferase [Magnetococcales bacterium]